MEFSKPDLFILFIFVILFIIIYLLYSNWRKKIISSTFHANTINQILPGLSFSIKHLHFLLRIIALSFLIIAIVGPKLGTKLNKVKREGVDVVFLIDVSKSMLVEDVAPNRLLKSLKILSNSIDNLVADRVGIIVYAGNAYPLMPLSFDYSMAKLLISTINTDIVPTQGTDVVSAIELADSFFDSKERSRAIFIISDGEDHEIDYSKKLELTNANNVIISTINIGTIAGGPIPITLNGANDYKKDTDGNVVISKSNDLSLKAIASETNGNFIKTSNSDDAINFVSNNLKNLDKTLQEEEIFSDYESQFQWFLAVALFFLLFDLILSQKKINLLSKILKS
tara:strand:- start:138 stop:1154 length:1017 start_codon:yes stop_codon:yes gene_type:complete